MWQRGTGFSNPISNFINGTSLISKYPAAPSSVPFPGTEPSWIPEVDASSPVTASGTPTLSRASSHFRHFSVTPQALAALSEHNTDLLGLRAELDFAQERNGELEEQIENAEHVKQREDKGVSEKRSSRHYVYGQARPQAMNKGLFSGASFQRHLGNKDSQEAHPHHSDRRRL